MTERTAAILIDAGYVWKQVAKATGKQHRSDVGLISFGVPLIAALVEEAEGDDMRVLRTYWYDGAYNRLPNVQQRAVGRTPRVKLRLGSMSGNKQKGVDRLIQRDILALAANKAVSDLVVVTGDQDMEEELDAAGQHGLVVHVWGISDLAQQDDISGRLLRIVDEWKVLPADWAATFVSDEIGESQAEHPGHPVPLDSDSQIDAFRSRLLGAAGELQTVEVEAPEAAKWGTEQLQRVGCAAYDTLKEQYASTWQAVRDEIRASTWKKYNGETFRSIPGGYDTELIDAAEGILGITLTDKEQRVQIRNGFWDRFDEEVLEVKEPTS